MLKTKGAAELLFLKALVGPQVLQASLFHLPPIFTRAALWTFGTHPAQSPLTPPSDRIFRNAWCTPRNLKSRCNLWVDSPVKSLLVPVLCCSESSRKIRNLHLQGFGPPDPFLDLSLTFMLQYFTRDTDCLGKQ